MVRISAGSSRGTGFAIAADRILTSLHVVGKVVDGQLRLHGEAIKIAAAIADDAGRLRTPVCVCTRDSVVDYDADLDWIALEVDAEAFAGMTVLALGAPGADARWSTYGFPDASAELGKATGGEVTSTEAMVRLGATPRPVLQVFSREAGAASGGAVRGYSGAPVMVDGHVLGFLCAASEDASGRSVEGTLYAVPLGAVAERLGLALPAPAAAVAMVAAPAARAAAEPPLYPLTSAVARALGAGVLGALVAALLVLGVPAWVWIPVLAIGGLGCLAFVVGLAVRDPVAGPGRWLARLLVLVGLVAAIEGAASLAAAVVGRLAAAAPPDGALQAVLGWPWPFALGLFVAGGAAMAAATPLLRVPRALSAAGEVAALPTIPAELPAAQLPEVFHERIRMLFEKRAYEAFWLDTYDAAAGCLTGECRDATGSHRVVVRCDDRDAPVGDADVEAAIAFAAALPGARIHYATPAAVDPALAARCAPVKFVTEADLLNSLVYFDGYLKRVIEIYEKDPLPYSNTAPSKSLADTFVAPRFELHGSTGELPRAALRDYLDDWLADRRPRQIALLADYGMGKSSFLKHYAWHLARKRLAGEPVRIPILLSLTGKSPRNQPGVAGLLQAFIDQYQLRCEVAAFRVLMKAGRLVFLIDAFDEMDLVGDRAMRLDHFAELWRLYAAGNKLLFAGRPTFFPDEAEIREAFRIADRGPDRLAGGAYCERLSLAPLTDDDLAYSFDCYFDRATAQRHHEWVRGNPRLVDLARRPAMMHIIRDTIDELRAERAASITLREASLLKLYTDHWIVRQEGTRQRKLLVSSDLRARFSENLAVWMFEREQRSVKSRELGELFATWFPEDAARVASGAGARMVNAVGRSHLLEGIETDLRNCTYLVGDPEGTYSFAHKPFFEYFVAASIDRCLRDGRELPEVLQRTWWGTEIALHVADLWLLRAGGAIANEQAVPVFREITRIRMRVIARSGLRVWGRAIGGGLRPDGGFPPGASLASRVVGAVRNVIDFSPMRPLLAGIEGALAITTPPRRNALQVLLRAGIQFSWIRSQFFRRAWRIIGDPTHSTHCLSMLDLANARLDDTTLIGLDLSGRSLRGATLEHAELIDCRLDHADLTEARLTGAVLVRASLVGAVLRGVRLDDASVVGSRLDRANARDAILDRCTLHDVSLRFASLRRASLRGATIDGMLTGAELIGANLTGSRCRVDAARALMPADPPPPVELAPITLARQFGHAWSPDDSCIITLSRGSAWLIDAGDGSLIQRFWDPRGVIQTAAFRSPGEIAVASTAGTIAICDLVAGTRREVSLGYVPGMIALGATGTAFVATDPADRLVFGRCDEPGRATTTEIGAADADIISIAVDDAGAVAAALLRPTGPPSIPTTARTRKDDGAADARPARIAVVRRNGENAIVAIKPLPGAVRSGAQILVKGDGAFVAVVDGRQTWQFVLEAPKRRPDDADWIATDDVEHAYVWSPACTWFDTRDRDWVEDLPAQLAERLGADAADLPRPVHAHTGHELAVSGPGVLAIVDRTVGLYQPINLCANVLNVSNAPSSIVQDLRFLDDARLATAGLGTVRTWDLRELRGAASAFDELWFSLPVVLLGDGRAVRANRIAGEPRAELGPGEALCAGQHHLALALRDDAERIRAVAVIDLRTGARRAEIEAREIELAAFGPDDRWLALAAGHQVTVIDLDTDRTQRHALAVRATALAFLADRSCVVGDAAGGLHSVGRLGAFDGHETLALAAPITALAACGPVLAIATGDLLHTWTPGDAAPTQLAGPLAVTSRLALSPDGRLLAAASHDDIVRLYDLPSRSLAARLYHLEAGWAAVRADGKYRYGGDVSRLATASAMRTYRLADLDELLPDGRLQG